MAKAMGITRSCLPCIRFTIVPAATWRGGCANLPAIDHVARNRTVRRLRRLERHDGALRKADQRGAGGRQAAAGRARGHITLADRLVDLVDEGYDLAVRIARLQASSLVSRQLTSTRMILCASPEYLRRHGVPEHPSEIARHAVISYTLLSMGEQWEFEGPQGPVSVEVAPRMRTNSGDTCCAAAVQHQGLVLQPSFLVGAHLASGALVEVLPEHRSIELGVYAIYPSRKHLTPKVRALIEFLVNAFRMRAWPA